MAPYLCFANRAGLDAADAERGFGRAAPNIPRSRASYRPKVGLRWGVALHPRGLPGGPCGAATSSTRGTDNATRRPRDRNPSPDYCMSRGAIGFRGASGGVSECRRLLRPSRKCRGLIFVAASRLLGGHSGTSPCGSTSHLFRPRFLTRRPQSTSIFRRTLRH